MRTIPEIGGNCPRSRIIAKVRSSFSRGGGFPGPRLRPGREAVNLGMSDVSCGIFRCRTFSDENPSEALLPPTGLLLGVPVPEELLAALALLFPARRNHLHSNGLVGECHGPTPLPDEAVER